MKFTSMALGLALTFTATPAWAGDKQQTNDEMIQIAQRIRTERAAGHDVSELQARYDQLSARLGGDDPARLLGRAPTASAAAGQLNAVTSVPPGSTSTTTSFSSANVIATIDSAVVTDTIAVAGLDTYLWDVDVTLDITHTWAADLDLYLVSPAGTRINLSSDNGGSNDDVFSGTLFDDSQDTGAVTWAYANLTTAGPLSPEGNLHRLLGEDPNGIWTLEVGDDAGGDGGFLNGWTIDVTTLPAAPAAPSTASMSNTTPFAIVDNALVTDSMTFSGLGSHVAAVRLYTEITHTWAADLDIYLVHDNSGTRINLTTDNGGSNDDVFVGTVFDDSEPTSAMLHVYADLTPTGPLSPEGNLHRLVGLDPNSNWTLEVGDDAGGDTGLLNSWSIDVTTFAAAPAAPAGPVTISNTTPIAIVDNTLVSDTMVFAGLGTHAARVTLYTEITHTWAADIDLTLVSPAGTRVNVTFDNGGSNDDIFNGTAWSDDTVEGTNVPSSERLVTEVIYTNLVAEATLGGQDSFARFIGEDPNGTWTLELFDDAGGDTGSINRWDVSIETYLGAPPPIVNYCTAGTTQNGCNASMGGSGTPSLSNAGPFTITASGVEGQKSGILFYGITGRNASPWGIGGSSFLCVKAPTQRTPLQNSGGTNGACDGTMSLDWNGYVAANPLKAINQALVVGTVVDAQAWFRDQGSPRNTSLSDGVEFTVQP